MFCAKCGKEVNRLNHFFIPGKNGVCGARYCVKCAREEKFVTLV